MWTSEPTEVTGMGNLTAGQLLGRVDALLPNQYSRAEQRNQKIQLPDLNL